MRRNGQWMLLCVSSVLAVSCAASQLTPVTNLTQRLEFHGFSILPPQGYSWVFTKKDSQGAKFGRILREIPSERGHTFIAWAITKDVNEAEIADQAKLREFVERILKPGRRFKLVNSRVILAGSDCVRYNTAVEERENPLFPDKVLILTTRGVWCLHPDSRHLIHAGFSERYIKGEHQPLSMVSYLPNQEVEQFLKSLKIERIN